MDVNWPSINAVIIPASASVFLGDSCITNVHTRSTNAYYAGAIPSCQPINIIPFLYATPSGKPTVPSFIQLKTRLQHFPSVLVVDDGLLHNAD